MNRQSRNPDLLDSAGQLHGLFRGLQKPDLTGHWQVQVPSQGGQNLHGGGRMGVKNGGVI